METQFTTRHTDSVVVDAVTHWVIGEHDRTTLAAPDGTWDMVVLKHERGTSIMLTGQTTKAVPLHFIPGDELLTISFRASAFLSVIPPQMMLDRAVFLPNTRTRFRLGSNVFDIPTFENVEAFAQTLIAKDYLCQNDVVETLLHNETPAYSTRSMQRHFLQTTGITQSFYRQIKRAREAASLLQGGTSAIHVAHTIGYADQAHMSRSLKRILGQTPTEIVTQPRS